MNMKTYHRLYIATKDIDTEPYERSARFLSIPSVLEIKNSYRVDKDILKHLTLESDKDIDEASLKQYVAEDGFHQIHLILTKAEWKSLGLRESLYGQSRVVGTQIVTYGAWGTRRNIITKYDSDVQMNMTEETLGDWHEAHHGLTSIFRISNPTTHAVFYGFAAKDSHLKKARRWVRKPYPLQNWQQLPWHLLPDQNPKRVGLVAWIEELKKKLAQLLPPKPPLRNHWEDVTQHYGERNPLYSITGHHIGTDFATPVGTPIHAHQNCEIVEVGKGKELGNYCVVKYQGWYAVYSHLMQPTLKGIYKTNWVLGFTGNTGLSTGPHLHAEGWYNKPDRTRLREWRTLTFNILDKF